MVPNKWTIRLNTHTISGTNTHDRVPVEHSSRADLLSITTESGTVTFARSLFICMSVVNVDAESGIKVRTA